MHTQYCVYSKPVWDIHCYVVSPDLQEKYRESIREGTRKKKWWISGISRISGISGISGISPEFWGGPSRVFSFFPAVIVFNHLKNVRFSGDDFRDFPEFPEISGNFPQMSGISPGFRGENSGVFSRFQAVIACKHHHNDRFSGDDFPGFPEIPEIPENFRKIPEFQNFRNPKNSRNFRKFPATGFFWNFLYFFIFYALYRRVRGYKKL